MAMADILRRIEEEANEYASSVEAKTKSDIASVAEQAKKKREENESSLRQNFSDQAGLIEKRSALLLRNAEKSALLQAQKEVLDEVFAEALAKLQSLPSEKLEKIFSAFVSSIPVETGEILVAGSLEETMKKVIADSAKKFLVKKTDGKSGFVFEGEGFRSDFSFETMVQKLLRPQIEAEVFHSLFA